MKSGETIKKRALRMIESDEDVSRWVRNLNSDSAKDLYSESLYKFTQYTGLSPREIVEKFKENPKEAEDQLTDFILSMKGKRAPKSIHNYLVGIKSWLRHNGIEVKRKINFGNIRETPTIEDEYPPSQEELRRILHFANIKQKAAIALMAFAGLRPTTASNLRLKDIPELKIEGNKVRFTETPALIKVKSRNSKNSKPYMTFLSSEGCEYLQEYLEYRIKEGEKLTPNSYVVSYKTDEGVKKYGRRGFSKLIKKVFIKSEFPFRPYVLRAYFDTAIINAREVPYVYQQFWMGHSGNIEAIYTVNKNLPEWQIEEMRTVFKEKVEPRLQTISSIAKTEIEELRRQITMLQLQNKKYEEITSLMTSIFKETIPPEMYPIYSKLEKMTKKDNNFIRKVISEDELTAYPDWEIETQLSSGKISIRKQKEEQ